MQAFENLLEGFQVIDYSWRYVYVNNTVVKHSRCSKKEDLLGFTMMEKFPGIEQTDMFKALERCMDSRVSEQLINEFTYPDGSKGWFELRIEPVPEGIFILSLDISELVKLEHEKKEYTMALEEMLNMASHEIRQPVANCLGMMHILDNHEPTQEELVKIMSYVKISATRLDAFTKKLTAFIHELKERQK